LPTARDFPQVVVLANNVWLAPDSVIAFKGTAVAPTFFTVTTEAALQVVPCTQLPNANVRGDRE
jgi:hypothetical protein